MEDQSNFILDWPYYCHSKRNTEQLTESLLITTMELESAKFKAEQELKEKDNELIQLKHLLNAAIIEKNDAQNQYQTLLNQYRRSHRRITVPPPHSVASSVEDEHVTAGGFSDCEESIVSSSVTEPPVQFTPEKEIRVPAKALPEKGKLLEAVIKAGPLLQNLLLAGPLPQWRYPPPAVDTYQIPMPPVVVVPTPPPVHRLDWELNKKRGFSERCDSPVETKYRRFNNQY